MNYRGLIKNGVAVLDTLTPPPEGTRVRVEVESTGCAFIDNRSIEDLAADQNVEPISSLADLVLDWPAEDTIDELMRAVREARH